MRYITLTTIVLVLSAALSAQSPRAYEHANSNASFKRDPAQKPVAMDEAGVPTVVLAATFLAMMYFAKRSARP